MLQSGKASLGDDLYRILDAASSSPVGMFNSLKLKSEHTALDTINRLEAAIYAWKERISIQKISKSPARTSWSLKDPSMELDKIEFLINRAELLLQQIRNRYPNLPQTFLDVMKIQYGKVRKSTSLYSTYSACFIEVTRCAGWVTGQNGFTQLIGLTPKTVSYFFIK